jgi:hypothetical protein
MRSAPSMSHRGDAKTQDRPSDPVGMSQVAATSGMIATVAATQTPDGPLVEDINHLSRTGQRFSIVTTALSSSRFTVCPIRG